MQATPLAGGRGQFELMFEQRPFDEPDAVRTEDASLTARKLCVFDMVRHFEARRADAVLLPCFLSHTFLDEIAGEVRVPILDARQALRSHLQRRHPQARRIGVLTSDRVRRAQPFERAFAPAGLAVIQPTAEVQQAVPMPAVYGSQGLKAGHLQGDAVDRLESACRDLLARGAEVIVPGFTEIPIAVEALRERGLPVVDSNRVYAGHAAADTGGVNGRR